MALDFGISGFSTKGKENQSTFSSAAVGFELVKDDFMIHPTSAQQLKPFARLQHIPVDVLGDSGLGHLGRSPLTLPRRGTKEDWRRRSMCGVPVVLRLDDDELRLVLVQNNRLLCNNPC